MNPERRRTARVTVSGRAIVHAASNPVRCHILNLSLGGMLLHAPDVDALRATGGRVAIDVHLDADSSQWTRVFGRVHRFQDAHAFCVAFDYLAPAFEDAVEDEVLASLEAERRPPALVVDADAARAERLADGLRAAGCHPQIVTSPLEAIWFIEQSQSHVAIVLVSEPLSAGTLMDFLRSSHPGIVRAAIGDRPSGSLDDLEWVFTDQPDLGRQLRRLTGRFLAPAWATAILQR